jgi:hypothetical protein
VVYDYLLKNTVATRLLPVLCVLVLSGALISDAVAIRFPTLEITISPINVRITSLVLTVQADSDTNGTANLLVVFESSSQYAMLSVETHVITSPPSNSYMVMEPRYETLYYANPADLSNKTDVYQPKTYESVKCLRDTALGYWGESEERPVITSYRLYLGENIRKAQKAYSEERNEASIDALVITGRIEFKVVTKGIVQATGSPYLRTTYFADVKLCVSDINSLSESSFELGIPAGITIVQFSSNLVRLRPDSFWTSLSPSRPGNIEERFYVQYEREFWLFKTPCWEILILLIGATIKPAFDLVSKRSSRERARRWCRILFFKCVRVMRKRLPPRG